MSAEHEPMAARLFFALWPDDAVRSRVAEVAGEFRKMAAGKWVRPSNLHVTLAFLGEIEPERWPELSRIAADTAAPDFALRLDRLEFWRRNGIVCLAPSRVPRALEDLVANLTSRLGEAGFRMESRPYRAHLTLARQGQFDRGSLPLTEPVDWNIHSFSLLESRLDREGTTYLQRETWLLQKSAVGTPK
jgi:2'-5' RNA ligase